MQLVAYGAQDVYLTGNPQITFFKVVYRRHTNFACEAIEQTFNGTVAFGRKATCQITRNGDLVTKMWLKATINKGAGAWVDKVGYALIKSVELQIGGTRIDKHYGHWMHVWDELTRSDSHAASMTAMIESSAAAGTNDTLFVPLQFFCCRNDGLALPLIALQYHDVRVEFEFESLANLGNNALAASAANTIQASLLVEYVYLDSEERKRFAQASHEYLIEQLQFTGAETVNAQANGNKFRLNFNHPCKELVFAAKNFVAVNTDDVAKFANFTADNAGTGANPVANALLQLNGHDRASSQPGSYYNYVQPRDHHSRTPANGINVYSFALNPEEHQPSGTCNFSRIDNAQLNVNFSSAPAAGCTMNIYATNYNVLRVMSGMGGVAYSN
jgi:hypothetical protein